MPRFSILLPTHNRADVIAFAIKSILAQSEQDFELLIVGDGCTDETADVVAKFKDKRIRWFALPKAPFSGYANRNTALRSAQGEMIAYAQHDDLMLPDHLAQMAQIMGTEIGWAYSRPLWVSTDGIVVPGGTNLLIPRELTHFLEVANSIPSNCVVHRRHCFDQFGYWPEDEPRIGDWRLWKKIIAGIGVSKIAYLPMPTTLHFSANWKNSRSSASLQVDTWLRIIDDGEWWPPILRHSVPAGVTEQEILFEALQGGDPFVRALREAVVQVMDCQGWDNIQRALPRIRELEDANHALNLGNNALRAQLHSSQASLKAAQTSLDAVLSSNSWRATKPFRRIKTILLKALRLRRPPR
jgi:hypothetical protein